MQTPLQFKKPNPINEKIQCNNIDYSATKHKKNKTKPQPTMTNSS